MYVILFGSLNEHENKKYLKENMIKKFTKILYIKVLFVFDQN